MCIIQDRIDENSALIAQDLLVLAQLEPGWHRSQNMRDTTLDQIAAARAGIAELEEANAILLARLRDDRNLGPRNAIAT